MSPATMTFQGSRYVVKKDTWPNGLTRLLAYSDTDDRPLRLTINVPDRAIASITSRSGMRALGVDEVILKNYSENQGVYDALLVADIVSPAFDVTPLGYTDCVVVRVLI